MAIEDDIRTLEIRIQQAIIMADGCTERAELAATQAEASAVRAELAMQQALQGQAVSMQAATIASQSADQAVFAMVETAQLEEQIEEGLDDADNNQPIEGGSPLEGEAGTEVADVPPERENQEREDNPIIIRVTESKPAESHHRTTAKHGFRSLKFGG